MKINEQRKLLSITVTYLNDIFHCIADSGADKTIRATPEGFVKFLRVIKASDYKTLPRSERNITYVQMTDEIMRNVENRIFVWDSYWNSLPDQVIID